MLFLVVLLVLLLVGGLSAVIKSAKKKKGKTKKAETQENAQTLTPPGGQSVSFLVYDIINSLNTLIGVAAVFLVHLLLRSNPRQAQRRSIVGAVGRHNTVGQLSVGMAKHLLQYENA